MNHNFDRTNFSSQMYLIEFVLIAGLLFVTDANENLKGISLLGKYKL